MRLEYSEKKITEPLSEFVIADCIRDCINTVKAGTARNGSFVVLEGDRGLIQTCVVDEDSSILQYQENAEYFECSSKSLNAKELIAAFLSFYRQDQKWKSSLTWEIDHSHDDDETESEASSFWPFLLFIAFLVALIVFGEYSNR